MTVAKAKSFVSILIKTLFFNVAMTAFIWLSSNLAKIAYFISELESSNRSPFFSCDRIGCRHGSYPYYELCLGPGVAATTSGSPIIYRMGDI